MTMGATLVWPVVVVLGFCVFTAVVVVLGASSTARYEFERNAAQQPQQRAASPRSANHPAGRRAPARPGETAAAPNGAAQASSVAVRPAPAAVADRPAARDTCP